MKRRDFLRMTAAAMFAAASSPWSESWADDLSDLTDVTNDSVPLDENIVAIFSDTHTQVPITTHQPQRLIQCVKAVLNMNPRPANLLIYGDVAYLQGRVVEYELFKKIIAPIDKAGIKWEAAMGNHDRLNNFYTVFPERKEEKPLVADRYVHVVKTPRADFILLDSYMEGQVRGEIRPDQRAWLEDQLKAYAGTTKSVSSAVIIRFMKPDCRICWRLVPTAPGSFTVTGIAGRLTRRGICRRCASGQPGIGATAAMPSHSFRRRTPCSSRILTRLLCTP